jgi:hypothetical protein
MARMTEEEAWAMDELVTNADITLGPNGSGWLSQREARLFGLDNITLTWVNVKAAADHKSPGQIINEIIHEKIASVQ